MHRKILAFAGVLFCLWGCYCVMFAFTNYQSEQSQKDWPVTEATVFLVEQRKESSGIRHRSTRVVYDITYEYQVEGVWYTGEDTGLISKMEIGEPLSIKYDPQAPENSTTILAPQPEVLMMNLAGGVFFLLIGIWMIVFPPGRKRKDTPDYSIG